MKRAPSAAVGRSTRRNATNVSVRPEIVREARELGLNLSRVFEQALQEAILNERRCRWVEENRTAIEAYNARVDKQGVFSDAWRKF